MKRIVFLDIAKGLLLFLVYLGHIERYGDTVSTIIFSFHMPAFFIISGYTFNLDTNKTGGGQFLVHTARRTLLPYFIFAGVGAIIRLLNGQYNLFGKEMIKQLLVLCMPDLLYTGAGWFLIAMFFADIFMYIWIKYFPDFQMGHKALIIFLLYFFAVNIVNLNNAVGIMRLPFDKAIGATRIPFRLDCSLMTFFFMLVGYYLNRSGIIEILSKKWIYFIILFLAYFPVMKINGWVNLANCSYNNPFYYFMESILGTIFLLLLSVRISKIKILSKVLAEVGKNTLPMFMMHGMFLSYMGTHLNIEIGNVVKPISFLYALLLMVVTYPLGKIYTFALKNLTRRKGK